MQTYRLKTVDALEYLGIRDRKTLWNHAKKLGINTKCGFYDTADLDRIRQQMTDGGNPETVETAEDQGHYYQSETAEMANDAIASGFIQPYAPIVDAIAKPVAQAVFQQVHQAIARELFAMTKQQYTPPLVQAAHQQLASVRQSGLLLAGSDVPVHAIAPH